MLPCSHTSHSTSRRTAAAAALLLALTAVVAGCGSSGRAATDAVPTEPVGGLARRLSPACTTQIAAYEATSRKQIALGERLDKRATALGRSLTRQDKAIDALEARNADADPAIDRYNDGVDRLNALDRRVGELADQQIALLLQYERTATRCLDEILNWDTATTALESALAPAARAAGSDRPSVICDPPYAKVEPVGPDDFEEQGYVYEGDRLIHLTARVCLDLERVVVAPASLECVRGADAPYATCTPTAEDAIVAIATLAHEQQHVDGVDDEATADCYALQKAKLTATVLGVSDAVAGQIAPFTDQRFEPAEVPVEAVPRGGRARSRARRRTSLVVVLTRVARRGAVR